MIHIIYMPNSLPPQGISNLVGGNILENIAIPAVFRRSIFKTTKRRKTKKNKSRRVRFSRKRR